MALLKLDSIDESLFRDTAGTMRFVGIFWMVIAGLLFVPSGLSLLVLTMSHHAGSGGLKVVLAFVDSVTMGALGFYTVNAAGRLLAAARQGEGDAAPAVMDAFGDLKRMFMFWAISVGADLATDVIDLVVK
jgi:hypothetical protein